MDSAAVVLTSPIGIRPEKQVINNNMLCLKKHLSVSVQSLINLYIGSIVVSEKLKTIAAGSKWVGALRLLPVIGPFYRFIINE